ncbi:Potassium-transporting ATPase C chain [compost metagenome]
MKNTFIQALKLTVVCLIFFSGIYTLIVLGIAQMAPNQGKGELITDNGKTYYANIGQSFTEEGYFNSRPSAVAYNAAGSGGSNKGPSNPEYLAEVQKRIDTFLILNPGIDKKDIPADLVTASGSGLDPHISILSAKLQIKRIAKARGIEASKLNALIEEQTEKPLLGLFGPQKINVLKLNIALNKLK